MVYHHKLTTICWLKLLKVGNSYFIFKIEHHFYWEDDKLCHFKQWQQLIVFIANEEIQTFRWEWEFWKTSMHHEFCSFPIIIDFLLISVVILTGMVLRKTLHKKMYQRLEDLHNLSNQYFPNGDTWMLQNHACIK